MSIINFPWITVSIFLPIFFAFVILFLNQEKNIYFVKIISLIVSLLSFSATIPLYIFFDIKNPEIQFECRYSWIEYLHINYHVGIDGISLWFVILTSFITFLIILYEFKEDIDYKSSHYLASFLLLSGLMIGVFVSLDAILFYIFFESTLIPMYLIIGLWGGKNKIYAAFKLFLYTLFGSLLMFVAFIYLYNKTGTFDILSWYRINLNYQEQFFIFLAFLLAFAIKIPMFPFHTWLPDVHVEAPTTGSMVLASIMLKLGAYAILRFSLPIVTQACFDFSKFIIIISLISIFYVGLIAIVQQDMKKLVAYSSISHMGFVTLGIFVFNTLGIEGAIIQMISHGLISAAMFFCIGVLYHRNHSRLIVDYGGVVSVMPRFITFFVLFSMASAGLPGTSGFVGEFLVIVGTMKSNIIPSIISATSLIIGASYSLWMLKRVAFGPINNNICKNSDLDKIEFFILLILAVLVIFIGIYPKPFTDVIHVSVQNLLNNLTVTKI